MQIYFTVSTDQKSWRGVCGFSSPAPTRMESSCQLAVSFSGTPGFSQAHSGCWPGAAPGGVGLRSQVPCWLSAEGCSRLFEASCAPGHRPLHLQSQQWRRSLTENPSKTPNLSNFSTSYLHTVIQRDLDLIMSTQITSLS